MRLKRVIIGCVILVLLLGLMVYSFEEFDRHDPQLKKYRELFGDVTSLNNTSISFSAEIQSIHNVNQTIFAFIKADPYSFPLVEIDVGALETPVLKPGDQIDVIGIVHGNGFVTASQLWRIEPWQLPMVFLRSLLAIPFILYLFFSTWMMNTSTGFFERRKKHV